MQIAIKTLIHDFNNDLTIINGIIALTEKVINRGGSIEEVRGLILKLKGKIEHIKSDLRQMVSNDEDIDLEKYLIENKTRFEDDYKVSINCRSNGDFPLRTTKGKLNRFLQNVVKNAVEAQASQVDFFLTSTYFLIKDNGIGIPLHILNQINQDSMASSKTEHGHGYGIISLKEFCYKHNLHFQISNSPTSNGAQITIRNNLSDTRLAS